MKRRKLALFEFFGKARILFIEAGKNLGRKYISKRIALETSTNAPTKPMDVLQATVAIIGWTNPKVMLITFVPSAWKIADRKLAFEHLELELKSNHDMKIIGQLIGLGPDERSLNFINRAYEVFA